MADLAADVVDISSAQIRRESDRTVIKVQEGTSRLSLQASTIDMQGATVNLGSSTYGDTGRLQGLEIGNLAPQFIELRTVGDIPLNVKATSFLVDSDTVRVGKALDGDEINIAGIRFGNFTNNGSPFVELRPVDGTGTFTDNVAI